MLMPIWFFVLLAVCAPFAVRAAMRGLGSEGLIIADQKISRVTVVLATIIIVTAFGLIALIELGLFPDHAP